MMSVLVAIAFVAFVFFVLMRNWKSSSSLATIEAVRMTLDELPSELLKYKPFYEKFGYPLKQCTDHAPALKASTWHKIYGSSRAAVVYNPGALNGSNWRVCGLDETGQYETFSMNMFATKADAIQYCCDCGFEFEVHDEKMNFKSLSEKLV